MVGFEYGTTIMDTASELLKKVGLMKRHLLLNLFMLFFRYYLSLPVYFLVKTHLDDTEIQMKWNSNIVTSYLQRAK